MQAPQQLIQMRELRWMLSSGLGLLGPFDAALVALQASLGGSGGGGAGGGGGGGGGSMHWVCCLNSLKLQSQSGDLCKLVLKSYIPLRSC
jgi:hypothetical protein